MLLVLFNFQTKVSGCYPVRHTRTKMGNVMAAGPPPPPPPPPSIIVNMDDKPLENPGTVEELHKKTKGKLPS